MIEDDNLMKKELFLALGKILFLPVLLLGLYALSEWMLNNLSIDSILLVIAGASFSMLLYAVYIIAKSRKSNTTKTLE